MKLKRRQKRQAPETIVALIDVVFFLLVFFMLIGRMDATSPFDVTPPVATAGADLPAGGTTVTVSDSGELALNGREVERTALITSIASAVLANPDLFVRINAHRDTELHHILPLVSELEAKGAADIVFIVSPDSP